MPSGAHSVACVRKAQERTISSCGARLLAPISGIRHYCGMGTRPLLRGFGLGIRKWLYSKDLREWRFAPVGGSIVGRPNGGTVCCPHFRKELVVANGGTFSCTPSCGKAVSTTMGAAADSWRVRMDTSAYKSIVQGRQLAATALIRVRNSYASARRILYGWSE